LSLYFCAGEINPKFSSIGYIMIREEFCHIVFWQLSWLLLEVVYRNGLPHLFGAKLGHILDRRNDKDAIEGCMVSMCFLIELWYRYDHNPHRTRKRLQFFITADVWLSRLLSTDKSSATFNCTWKFVYGFGDLLEYGATSSSLVAHSYANWNVVIEIVCTLRICFM
jgi:hypothetical protein